MNNEKVSIVMPAYKAQETIEESINSVINQTYSNWELIIINDDPENTALNKIIDTYLENNKIKVIFNRINMGVSESRNLGIDRSTGKYIAFLDSDDIWDVDKLNYQIKYMIKHKNDFTYTSVKYITHDGELHHNWFEVPRYVNFTALQKFNVIATSSVILNKKVIKKTRFYDDSLHEDYLFWLNILSVADYAHGVYTNKPLLIYRLSKQSKSSNKMKSIFMTYRVHRKLKQNPIDSVKLTMNHVINSGRKYKNIYT